MLKATASEFQNRERGTGSWNLLRLLRTFPGAFEAVIRYNPTFTGTTMFKSESIKLLAPHLSWRTHTLAPEERLRGWVAGELIVVSCHFANKASRPCRRIISEGKVRCYCADVPTSTRQLGYLPLVTPNRERVVILMCATTARKAALLAPTEAVEFVRPKTAKTGLYFNRLHPAEMGDGPVLDALRRAKHDIREYLWRVLWQDPELVAYFEALTGRTANTPEVKDRTAEELHESIKKLEKRPPLVRRPAARDNVPSVAELVQGIGKGPDAA